MYRGVRHILFRPGRRFDRGRPHQLVATADADVGMLLSYHPSPWGCRRWTTTSSSSVRVDGRILAGHRLRLLVFFSVIPKHPADVTTADVFAFLEAQRSPPPRCPVIRLEDREHGLAVRTIKRRLASVSGLFASLVARGNAGVTAIPVPRGQSYATSWTSSAPRQSDLLRDAVPPGLSRHSIQASARHACSPMLNDATPWDGDLSARGRRSLPRVTRRQTGVTPGARGFSPAPDRRPRGSRSCAVTREALAVSTAEELLAFDSEQRAQAVERALAERWDQTLAREAVAGNVRSGLAHESPDSPTEGSANGIHHGQRPRPLLTWAGSGPEVLRVPFARLTRWFWQYASRICRRQNGRRCARYSVIWSCSYARRASSKSTVLPSAACISGTRSERRASPRLAGLSRLPEPMTR